MHSITFYPLGNADTTLIHLDNGKNILFDFAHLKCAEDENDKKCDLIKELNDTVTNSYFDVVCFTHLDNDHVSGSKDYFHFEHSNKYQGDDRKKITELWVPAEIITESRNNLNESAKAVQAEARYRLKNKTAIRVFSSSKKLEEWCEKNDGYDFDKIKHLIVNAGTLVPSLTLDSDGVEFFAHCPFYSDSLYVDRNNNAVVVQVVFDNPRSSKIILGSDIGYEVWEDIIKITKIKDNHARLEWDLFHLSHHCSYKALAEDKGKTKTNPSENIRWLFETQAKDSSIIISPSNPIPSTYGPESGEQPPHKQAYNYYSQDTEADVKVTMEYPNENKPKPIKFNINNYGLDLATTFVAVNPYTPTTEPHRAG